MGSHDPETDQEGFETRLDDHLRSELSRAFPAGSEAIEAYSQLSSKFTVARRVNQLKQGVIGVAASVALFAGVGFGIDQLADRTDDGLTVAGVPEVPEVDGDTDGGPSGGDDADDALAVTGTTSGSVLVPKGEDGTTTVTAADGFEAPKTDESPTPTTQPDLDDEPTTAPEAVTTTTSVDQGATQTSADTPQTTAPTTTAAPNSPDSTVVESSCGTITVEISGSDLELVDTDPNPGYSVDEKSTGPESIEVSFEGPRGHCELKGRIEDGELVITEDD